MTDYKLDAEPGSYRVSGSALDLEVKRGAESWQFFAFGFAALVTLMLAILDEVPHGTCPWWCRALAKIVLFFLLGYLTLWNNRVRGWLLSTLLPAFKRERYRA